MSKRQTSQKSAMRPNIRVTHTLNGRVKDYADQNDMTTSEAYREIIEAGLEELERDDDD